MTAMTGLVTFYHYCTHCYITLHNFTKTHFMGSRLSLVTYTCKMGRNLGYHSYLVTIVTTLACLFRTRVERTCTLVTIVTTLACFSSIQDTVEAVYMWVRMR